MKNKIKITFIAIVMSLIAAGAFSGESFLKPLDSAVIKEATSLSVDELKVLFKGDPETIIKWSSEDTFPLKLSYESEFFSLDTPKDLPYSVAVKRDFYVYVPKEENILLSLDGHTWKTFTEIATGNLSVGFGRDDKSNEHFVKISGLLSERNPQK